MSDVLTEVKIQIVSDRPWIMHFGGQRVDMFERPWTFQRNSQGIYSVAVLSGLYWYTTESKVYDITGTVNGQEYQCKAVLQSDLTTDVSELISIE